MKKQVILTLITLPVLLFWQTYALAFPAPVASAVEEDEGAVVSPLPEGAHIASSETNKNDFYVLGAGQKPPQEQKMAAQNNGIKEAQSFVPTPPPTQPDPATSVGANNTTSVQPSVQGTPPDDLSDKTTQSPGDKELSHQDMSLNQTDAPPAVMQSAENVQRAPVDEIMPTEATVQSGNQAVSSAPLQHQASNGNADDVEVIPHKMVHQWEKHHKA